MTDSLSTILIVDDKPANILALESLLLQKKRRISKAYSGEEALKMVLHDEPDLIILDVQMPDMNGFEVAQVLKLNHRTREIPIIFVTAESVTHNMMMKGFEEGALDYMTKPIEPELLKAKVSVLLKFQIQKKELRRKNLELEKSALLINNSSDIIGIIDRATLRLEQVNSAFTEILGYDEREREGMSLFYFVDKNEHASLRALARSKQEHLSFQSRIYTQKREQRWLHWKVRSKDEKWYFNARDITDIKEVEKIRNYLATLVKQSNSAVYISDTNGNIISWNNGAEKIYGYSEKEALRMKIWNIIPEVVRAEANALIDGILAGRDIKDIATKRINRYGKVIDVNFSASLIRDAESKQASIAITETDITQQLIAEERIRKLNNDLENNIKRLESSNQELESFSYSVSHDLRAPLRALDGYARILMDDYAATIDEEGKRFLENIQKNARRMGTLIDDLLNLSRLGRAQLQKTPIRMSAMVQEVVDELRSQSSSPFKLVLHDIEDAPVDYNLFKQVWLNLIGNAVKYSSKKTEPMIEIGSMAGVDSVEYYVKDNGVGFDMKFADKLFGVFQRLHSQNEFEGTGVGLAIVKRIVTKHGGLVRAESEVDSGTTFFFSIPRTIDE